MSTSPVSRPLKRSLENPNFSSQVDKKHKPCEVATKTHHLTLKKIYIHRIRSKDKTIEGRIADNRVKKLKPGDDIRFYYYTNSKDEVRCRILEINKFDSFREMLQHYGVENCLPGAKVLDEGIKLYDAIPGYAEKEKKNGVLGIKLEVHS